jgi:hypothetical protein
MDDDQDVTGSSSVGSGTEDADVAVTHAAEARRFTKAVRSTSGIRLTPLPVDIGNQAP